MEVVTTYFPSLEAVQQAASTLKEVVYKTPLAQVVVIRMYLDAMCSLKGKTCRPFDPIK